MALSEQTLDHLLEAEGNIRAAIKCAAVNEKPLVVTQLSKLLYVTKTNLDSYVK